MRKANVTLVSVVVAVAACVAATSASAGTNECKGIKNCIDVVGPWVVVTPHGETTFLLSCPKKGGAIGGLDAMATTTDVRISFDGLAMGPVAAGVTTGHTAFFRAVSAKGLTGAFQPRLGCIPSSSSTRVTTSARPVNPGTALVHAATTVKVVPGSVQRAAISCPRGSRFLSSWSTTAFQQADPPNVGLAKAIQVTRSDSKTSSVVVVNTSEALPQNAHAQVQLGVVCAG
jgi:hypothetical protein